MPFVDFSDSDLLRNKLVDIAWYTLELGLVSEWSPTKDGQSNNLTIEAVVICNADNGDTAFAGIPVTIRFNDKPKARGFIEGFLRALGEKVEVGRYELGAVTGQRIDAFVDHNTYEGRTRNDIKHKYRAVRSAQV